MLAALTLDALGARFRAGEATPSDAARDYLARIEALDPRVRAFVTVTRDVALAQAAEADARFGEGLVVGVEREGDDVMVTVRFASVGRKRLSLQYAHLEEIDS